MILGRATVSWVGGAGIGNVAVSNRRYNPRSNSSPRLSNSPVYSLHLSGLALGQRIVSAGGVCCCTVAGSYNHPPATIAGWRSGLTRRTHNPKIAGSNPAPATMPTVLAVRLSAPCWWSEYGPNRNTRSYQRKRMGSATNTILITIVAGEFGSLERTPVQLQPGA